jgi:hypothetical protein
MTRTNTLTENNIHAITIPVIMLMIRDMEELQTELAKENQVEEGLLEQIEFLKTVLKEKTEE